jgi:hypothetical protein
MMFYRDSDTGYYDPDEALEAAYEAEEERYQQEILASHSPECESDIEMATRLDMPAASEFYRQLAIELLKEVA